MFMVGEPGALLLMHDTEGTGVLIEVVDGEQVAVPLPWPDRIQARLAGTSPLIRTAVSAEGDLAVTGYFDVAHRCQLVRKLRTQRASTARFLHRALPAAVLPPKVRSEA